jgi:hypothetical protein
MRSKIYCKFRPQMKLLVIKKKFDRIPNAPLPVTITANFTMHRPEQSYL